LLGASIDHIPAPIRERERNLPSWLGPTVLKEWETPLSMHRRYGKVMASYLKQPAGLLRGLRSRWPNPIEATVILGAPFNEAPRFPFQLYRYVSQIAMFVVRLPELLQQRN